MTKKFCDHCKKEIKSDVCILESWIDGDRSRFEVCENCLKLIEKFIEENDETDFGPVYGSKLHPYKKED